VAAHSPARLLIGQLPIQAVNHAALEWVQMGYSMRQRLAWPQN